MLKIVFFFFSDKKRNLLKMKKFYSIKNINDNYNDLIENSKKICVNGWIKNCRFQKNIFY